MEGETAKSNPKEKVRRFQKRRRSKDNVQMKAQKDSKLVVLTMLKEEKFGEITKETRETTSQEVVGKIMKEIVSKAEERFIQEQNQKIETKVKGNMAQNQDGHENKTTNLNHTEYSRKLEYHHRKYENQARQRDNAQGREKHKEKYRGTDRDRDRDRDGYRDRYRDRDRDRDRDTVRGRERYRSRPKMDDKNIRSEEKRRSESIKRALHTVPRWVPRLVDNGKKILILFDLNGTLTSTTNARVTSGRIELRPGLENLQKLAASDRFILGVFSSATKHTVEVSIREIFHCAQVSFGVTLCRHHCIPIEEIPELSGTSKNPWDTIKPLSRYFAKEPLGDVDRTRGPNGFGMDRVILVDDEIAKVHPDERNNLIHIPRWETTNDDNRIKILVDELLCLPDVLDTREHTARISAELWNSLPKKSC